MLLSVVLNIRLLFALEISLFQYSVFTTWFNMQYICNFIPTSLPSSKNFYLYFSTDQKNIYIAHETDLSHYQTKLKPIIHITQIKIDISQQIITEAQK